MSDKIKKTRAPSPVYTERACKDCGRILLLHIKSTRCPVCQRAAKLAADRACKQRQRQGLTRRIGSVDLCQSCGQPYTVSGGLQRYCKACAAQAVADNDRATSRDLARRKLSDAAYRDARNANRRNAEFAATLRTCPVCGKDFAPAHGRQVSCSPECSAIQRARNNKKYREDNAERLNNQRKARLAAKKAESNKEGTP